MSNLPIALMIATGTYAGPLSLGVSALIPDAAVAMSPGGSFSPSWPVVVAGLGGPEGGGGATWYDAAMVYRSWVLPNSAWTKEGPSGLPDWYRDVQTFINSHWQQTDIFNVSGGDPAVVSDRVSALADRLGLEKGQLALHWYEWDTLGYTPVAAGGDEYDGPCPPEAVNCGFDTNYPAYFPARAGFEEACASIQEEGVPVFPYINGRIFDQV